MPPEIWSLINFIFKERCGTPTKRKNVKNVINRKSFHKNVRSRSFILVGPLVLAELQCYYGNNKDKIQTSFKTLFSKKARTWR